MSLPLLLMMTDHGDDMMIAQDKETNDLKQHLTIPHIVVNFYWSVASHLKCHISRKNSLILSDEAGGSSSVFTAHCVNPIMRH